MSTTYDLKNFAAHDVTQEEVEQVLRSDVTAEFDLAPSQRGNERMMLVGFTHEGRLLELGVEFFFDDDHVHVFHRTMQQSLLESNLRKRSDHEKKSEYLRESTQDA